MNFRDLLRVLMTPACWIRAYDTDLNWDQCLQRLIDEGDFSVEDELNGQPAIVRMKNHRIWVSNYPYAAGRPIPPERSIVPYDFMPRRATVLRLGELIGIGRERKADYLDYLNDQEQAANK